MPEEANMSFKVYLDLGGGRQEVRRFALPETVATNYSVLREKVCSIFGLANQDAVLSWKDSEGDSITISTDDELMEAVADSLSNQNAQLVRINVTEGSGRSEPGPSGRQGNQQGDIHPGVTCDGCNGVVQGFRYRCVTCQDFDLCGGCETKGMHKDHKMIRLPKPREAGAPWFFWKEKEDGPGQYSTHFGMQGGDAGGGGGFSSSASFSNYGGPGGGSGTWFGFGGPRGRHCHRRGHGARGRGAWPGWWGRGWSGRNWAGCAQGQTMGSDSGCQQQQQQSSSQQQSQQSQSQQQQHQQQQSGDGCPKEEGGCPWVNPEGAACPFMGEESEMPSPEQVAEEAKQMAHQMAQQAAQQAHHFASHYASDHLANVMRGIWTAWSGQQGPNSTTSSTSSSSSSSHSHSASTSKDAPQQGVSGEQKSEQAGQSSSAPRPAGEEYLRSVGETVATMLDPLGIDVEVAVEHNGIRQRCSLGENVTHSPRSNASPTPASPAKEPESSAASVVSAGSVNMEVQTEEQTEPQMSSNRDLEAMDVASPAPAEASQVVREQVGGSAGSPEPEDWMLVNQETSGEPASASGGRPKTPPNEKEKTVSYPSLVELTPHPDPKIQRALEQMSAMGYSNEGGWLTNLLEMKQGDINQVLDLLQPVNK